VLKFLYDQGKNYHATSAQCVNLTFFNCMVNAENVVAGFEFNDLWLPSAISLINFRFRGGMEIKTSWLQSGH
jgi:hypothetical protein